ncbi:unnamed protein product, partial [Ceratitis capitata]
YARVHATPGLLLNDNKHQWTYLIADGNNNHSQALVAHYYWLSTNQLTNLPVARQTKSTLATATTTTAPATATVMCNMKIGLLVIGYEMLHNRLLTCLQATNRLR